MSYRGRPGAVGSWIALIAVGLLLLSTVSAPALAAAAAPAQKTFDIIGTVDCGLASGKRCSIGDTVKLWTRDVSGNRELIEIDISWIKATLPALDQDDLLKLEVETRPEGGIRALRIFRPDKPKRVIEEDDDVRVDIEATPTPLPTPSPLPILSIDDQSITLPLEAGFDHTEIELVKAISVQQQSTVTMTFHVTLSPASSSQVTVQFATRDGTAQGGASCDLGADYITKSGTLTFSPGQTSKPIDVEICVDFEDSEDETFFVDLSNPQAAGFGDPLGVGTIRLPFFPR